MNRTWILSAVLVATWSGAVLAGDAAPPKPEEKKPPEDKKPQAVFILADGSRVIGETSIKEVAIKTAYGEVLVPAADVVRMRVARGSDKVLREKVAALIKQLGAPNFDDREKAYDELCKLGPLAQSQLQDAVKHPDAEVRSRIEKLLVDGDREGGEEDVEQEEAPLGGDEDELVARRFTLRGIIKVEKFSVKTRYGTLEIPREDVIAATLNRPEVVTKTTKVSGRNALSSMLGTGLSVRQGDRVLIKATGSISFRNWGETIGPDGNAERFGNQGPNNLPGMALVGRIGANGKAFLIGSSKQFTAEADGTLYLGVAFAGGTGSSTGDFRVVITVNPKGGK